MSENINQSPYSTFKDVMQANDLPESKSEIISLLQQLNNMKLDYQDDRTIIENLMFPPSALPPAPASFDNTLTRGASRELLKQEFMTNLFLMDAFSNVIHDHFYSEALHLRKCILQNEKKDTTGDKQAASMLISNFSSESINKHLAAEEFKIQHQGNYSFLYFTVRDYDKPIGKPWT